MNRASRSSLLIKIAMILFFIGCLLYPILQVLSNANINIEYMYAFTGTGPDEAYVVFRVNDVKTAEEVLNANGIETLSDESLKL